MDQLKFPVTLLSYNVGSQFNVSSCVFVFGPCPYIDWICSGHVLSHVSKMTDKLSDLLCSLLFVAVSRGIATDIQYMDKMILII